MEDERIKLVPLWEATGMEPPPGSLKIDPIMTTYSFGFERSAKRAWEECFEKVEHISVWRVRDPRDKPGLSLHYVTAMGEDEQQIRQAARICAKHGGRAATLAQDMARALALRRYGKVAEEQRRPPEERELKQHQRGLRHRLDKHGNLTPYEEQ